MKLAIRDFFWLLLVIGCLCGWWREHRERLSAEIVHKQTARLKEQWQHHAAVAQEELARKGVQIRFYPDGYSMEQPASEDPESWFGLDIFGEEMKAK